MTNRYTDLELKYLNQYVESAPYVYDWVKPLLHEVDFWRAEARERELAEAKRSAPKRRKAA